MVALFTIRLSGVFVIRRLRADMQFSAGGEQFKAKYVWQSLTDWKTYIASESCMLFVDPRRLRSLYLSGHIHGLVMSPRFSCGRNDYYSTLQ